LFLVIVAVSLEEVAVKANRTIESFANLQRRLPRVGRRQFGEDDAPRIARILLEDPAFVKIVDAVQLGHQGRIVTAQPPKIALQMNDHPAMREGLRQQLMSRI